MCLSDHERAPNMTHLALQACRVCSKCPPPSPPTDMPPRGAPVALSSTKQPAQDGCTSNGSKLSKTLPASDPPRHHYQMLPASNLTPRQCFQQSNDANGATITHGFHRETRTRSRERCRIPLMAPPTRQNHTRRHHSPPAQTEVEHDFRQGAEHLCRRRHLQHTTTKPEQHAPPATPPKNQPKRRQRASQSNPKAVPRPCHRGPPSQQEATTQPDCR